jgi:hypothetical protein
MEKKEVCCCCVVYNASSYVLCSQADLETLLAAKMKQSKETAWGKKLSLKDRLQLEEAYILKCPGEASFARMLC